MSEMPGFGSMFLVPPASTAGRSGVRPPTALPRFRGRVDDPRVPDAVRDVTDVALRRHERSAYLPPVVWRHDGDEWERVSFLDTPGAWLSAARADEPLITGWERREEGQEEWVPRGVVPGVSVVRHALAQLGRPDCDARILHIGSTGWMPAALSCGVKSGAVLGVDHDRLGVTHANQRLSLLHVPARVELTARADLNGPFDKVLATRAVHGDLPAVLIDAVRPGGVMVLPFDHGFGSWQALIRLTVTEAGRAEGRFTLPLAPGSFGWTPEHAPCPPPLLPRLAPEHGRPLTLPADFWPRTDFPTALFLAGLRVRDCSAQTTHHDESRTLTLTDTTPGKPPSQARLTVRGARDATLTTVGPRDLGTELLDGHGWWRSAGKPGLDRIGVTLTCRGGTSLHLDSARTERWLLNPSRPPARNTFPL